MPSTHRLFIWNLNFAQNLEIVKFIENKNACTSSWPKGIGYSTIWRKIGVEERHYFLLIDICFSTCSVRNDQFPKMIRHGWSTGCNPYSSDVFGSRSRGRAAGQRLCHFWYIYWVKIMEMSDLDTQVNCSWWEQRYRRRLFYPIRALGYIRMPWGRVVQTHRA